MIFLDKLMIWISKLVVTPGFSEGVFVDEASVEHVLLIRYEPSAKERVPVSQRIGHGPPTSYHSDLGKLNTIPFLAPSLILLYENSKRRIPEGEFSTLTRYNSYDIR